MKDQLVATARLSSAATTSWRSRLQGPNDYTDPPGDTSFVYKVKVGLFSDQDANEQATGNDTPRTRPPTSAWRRAARSSLEGPALVPGGLRHLQGRCRRDARLYYKLQYTTAAGQYVGCATRWSPGL
jgi:hypothetical protein